MGGVTGGSVDLIKEAEYEMRAHYMPDQLMYLDRLASLIKTNRFQQLDSRLNLTWVSRNIDKVKQVFSKYGIFLNSGGELSDDGSSVLDYVVRKTLQPLVSEISNVYYKRRDHFFTRHFKSGELDKIKNKNSPAINELTYAIKLVDEIYGTSYGYAWDVDAKYISGVTDHVRKYISYDVFGSSHQTSDKIYSNSAKGLRRQCNEILYEWKKEKVEEDKKLEIVTKAPVAPPYTPYSSSQFQRILSAMRQTGTGLNFFQTITRDKDGKVTSVERSVEFEFKK